MAAGGVYVRAGFSGPGASMEALNKFAMDIRTRAALESTRSAAEYVERYMKRITPWRTGNLRQSISTWLAFQSDKIANFVPYQSGAAGRYGFHIQNKHIRRLAPFGMQNWVLTDSVARRVIGHRQTEYSFVWVVGPTWPLGFTINFLEYGTGGRRVGGPESTATGTPYVIFPVATFALSIGGTYKLENYATRVVHPGIPPQYLMRRTRLYARDRVVTTVTTQARYYARLAANAARAAAIKKSAIFGLLGAGGISYGIHKWGPRWADRGLRHVENAMRKAHREMNLSRIRTHLLDRYYGAKTSGFYPEGHFD